MPTVRKRNGKYQVQVRVKGHLPVSKSFTNMRDAQLWGKAKEIELEKECLPNNDRHKLKNLTLADLVRRYMSSVTCHKNAGDLEALVLKRFLQHPISSTLLTQLTTQHFVQYRTERLKKVKPATLKRQLTPISNMFNVAKKEWGIPVSNPLDNLTINYTDQRRERRLKDGELEHLINVSNEHVRNPLIIPIVLFALETGMRRGEILSIEWRDIDWNTSTLTIPEAKNGYKRYIPLTPKAIEVLKLLGTQDTTQGPFLLTPNAFRKAWTRLIRKSGIEDLRFHDLRHEAISRFFEKGLNIAEVASISGHRDFKMLFRYTHPKPMDILKKLCTDG